MASGVASTACREVTANWSLVRLLPAPAETVTYGERSSDRLEVALVGLGDPPDSIGSAFLGIWSTSCSGLSRGRRLVCMLPS